MTDEAPADGSLEDGAQPEDASEPPRKRQAVILIHGMGEQRPMESLRKFVSAVWEVDAATLFPGDAEEGPGPATRRIHDAAELTRTWAKPSPFRSLFDMNVISTRYARNHDGGTEPGEGKATDFFELYWAHLMQGNTMGHVTAWVFETMLRRPGSVPPRLLPIWLMGWLIIVGVMVLSVDVAGRLTVWSDNETLRNWSVSAAALLGSAGAIIGAIAGVLSFVAGILSKGFLIPVLGDAARYLRDAPPNIAARQSIRQAGVDLLAKLHADGRYDRIVVAAHSLGTVIGYDVLRAFWALRHRDLAADPGTYEALERAAAMLRKAEGTPEEEAARTEFRRQQRLAFAAIRGKRHTPPGGSGDQPAWLISDFVTFGSPLAHADVLLRHDRAALDDALARLDLPTCPPTGEPGPARALPDGGEHCDWLVYPRFLPGETAADQKPHHGAVFLPVRWSNIYMYSPPALPLVGDFISGAVAPRLGVGVKDVRVRSPFTFNLVTHLHYWRLRKNGGDTAPARALRDGLNLTDRAE